jgi:hypothetical protein
MRRLPGPLRSPPHGGPPSRPEELVAGLTVAASLRPIPRTHPRAIRRPGGWPGGVGQAGVADRVTRERESGLDRFGTAGCLWAAGSTGAQVRRRRAIWESRPAPSERGGEIPQIGTSPRRILRIKRWADRILSEVGVRSRGRARSGSTRTSDSIAHADGFAARRARKHSSRPLQEQAQGSIGPKALATAPSRYGLGSGETP